jgi:serine O-acetyltransferase
MEAGVVGIVEGLRLMAGVTASATAPLRLRIGRSVPSIRQVAPASHYVRLFREDAARWVHLEEVVPLDLVTPGTLARLLLRHPPLRALGWFRFGSWAKASGIPGVPSWAQRRIARLYGLEISPGADIAGGLYVAHPVGTTISVNHMGRNVSVIAGVTIGARGSAMWPTIGDGVYVGAGARILGGIVIGEGATIGANAVVIDNVRAGSTVVGVPARELERRER